MASETVDPIDWSLLPTLHMAVLPERHLHTQMREINLCAIDRTRGNRLAYQAKTM